ncbi:MAG: hypothetical protein GY804_14025 [Alphaproteobacteria bacterium]|nr:hypothetical protein [Alphaproteobacteria bacterium]
MVFQSQYGDLKATGSITNLKLLTKTDAKKNDKGRDETITNKALSMILHREGKRSLYGGFTVDYQAPDSNEKIEVGRIKGVAVYTSVNSRELELALNIPEDVELKKGGTLFVKYEEDPKMGGDQIFESSITIE